MALLSLKLSLSHLQQYYTIFLSAQINRNIQSIIKHYFSYVTTKQLIKKIPIFRYSSHFNITFYNLHKSLTKVSINWTNYFYILNTIFKYTCVSSSLYILKPNLSYNFLVVFYLYVLILIFLLFFFAISMYSLIILVATPLPL